MFHLERRGLVGVVSRERGTHREHRHLHPVRSIHQHNLGCTLRRVRVRARACTAGDRPRVCLRALVRSESFHLHHGVLSASFQSVNGGSQSLHLDPRALVTFSLDGQVALRLDETARLGLELVLGRLDRRLDFILCLLLPRLLSLPLFVSKLVRGESFLLLGGELAPLDGASEGLTALVDCLVVVREGVTRAKAFVAARVLARERALVRVRALVRDEELALVEFLTAALVPAHMPGLLAAVALANVLRQVLGPRELLVAAGMRAARLLARAARHGEPAVEDAVRTVLASRLGGRHAGRRCHVEPEALGNLADVQLKAGHDAPGGAHLRDAIAGEHELVPELAPEPVHCFQHAGHGPARVLLAEGANCHRALWSASAIVIAELSE